MKQEYFLISIFALISVVIFYLFYQVIVPFLAPISWAAVFVVIFFPLYERTRARLKNPGLASLLMCGLIIIVIMGPISYLFVAVVNEAADAVARVNAMYKSGQLDQLLNFDIPWIASMKEKLDPYYDLSNINMDEMIRDVSNKVSGILVSQTTSLVANGTKTIFYFGLMIFTMYYFFKDGELLINKLKRLMPMSVKETNIAFGQLRDVIGATMYGGVVIALLQGVLGGLLFLILGIPSPVFWGAIMAFLAIIPIVGAFIIYVPAGIILALGGAYVKAIIVVAVGTLIISQVDNVIRPYLISGRTSLHPLLLFFTILGGIALFGLLGMVIGPMVAAGITILLKVFEKRLHADEDSIADSPAET